MGSLSSPNGSPTENADPNDIVHSGLLEGLQDYTVFRLRYPKRRAMRRRVLVDWYVQEVPSSAQICLVGVYRNNIIRTSPVVDIQTSQRVVTANCVYVLGRGCRVLEHDVRDGLNKLFVNGFPCNWREAVHQAFRCGADAPSAAIAAVPYSGRHSLGGEEALCGESAYGQEGTVPGEENAPEEQVPKDESDISGEPFEDILSGDRGVDADKGDGPEMPSSFASDDLDILSSEKLAGASDSEEAPAQDVREGVDAPQSDAAADSCVERCGGLLGGACADGPEEAGVLGHGGLGTPLVFANENPVNCLVDAEKPGGDPAEPDGVWRASRSLDLGTPGPEHVCAADAPVKKRGSFMTVEEALRNTPFYRNRPLSLGITAPAIAPEARSLSVDAAPPKDVSCRRPSIKILIGKGGCKAGSMVSAAGCVLPDGAGATGHEQDGGGAAARSASEEKSAYGEDGGAGAPDGRLSGDGGAGAVPDSAVCVQDLDDASFSSSPEESIRPNFSLLSNYIHNTGIKTRDGAPQGRLSLQSSMGPAGLMTDDDRFRRISLSGPFSDAFRADDRKGGTRTQRRSTSEACDASSPEPEKRASVGLRSRSTTRRIRKQAKSPADHRADKQCMSMDLVVGEGGTGSPEDAAETGMNALDALPDMVSFDDIVRDSPLSTSKRVSIRVRGRKSTGLADLGTGFVPKAAEACFEAPEERPGPSEDVACGFVPEAEKVPDSDSSATLPDAKSAKRKKIKICVPKKKRRAICRFSKK